MFVKDREHCAVLCTVLFVSVHCTAGDVLCTLSVVCLWLVKVSVHCL